MVCTGPCFVPGLSCLVFVCHADAHVWRFMICETAEWVCQALMVLGHNILALASEFSAPQSTAPQNSAFFKKELWPLTNPCIG